MENIPTLPIINKNLSKSELVIVQFLKKGMTNKEIANNLFVSVKAVKFHITNINKKLLCKNRVQIVLTAQELGL